MEECILPSIHPIHLEQSGTLCLQRRYADTPTRGCGFAALWNLRLPLHPGFWAKDLLRRFSLAAARPQSGFAGSGRLTLSAEDIHPLICAGHALSV
jgi:hypothetical protein